MKTRFATAGAWPTTEIAVQERGDGSVLVIAKRETIGVVVLTITPDGEIKLSDGNGDRLLELGFQLSSVDTVKVISGIWKLR